MKHEFTSAITIYIGEDIGGFADAFMNTDNITFESVYTDAGKYTNFVLVPPMKGLPPSELINILIVTMELIWVVVIQLH